MPDEPTIPVPMTRAQRNALALDRDWHIAQDLVAAYDAAVARPVDPERTCSQCGAKTHKLYGGEGRCPVMCHACWTADVVGGGA
jgi:hypothetical protein